jgi:hypothetical protein
MVEKLFQFQRFYLLFFIELALFTKYLREERDALHHDETIGNRKLDTNKDVTKAYSQQHMPTIPQFYEHVE